MLPSAAIIEPSFTKTPTVSLSSLPLRAALQNTMIFAGSVLVFFVCLELGLRVVNGQQLWPDRNFILERVIVTNRFKTSDYDPLLGWVMKPGLKLHSKHPHNSHTTGELGIRLNSPNASPQSPRKAILAVGDSFTAGSEVGDIETWPAHLERALGEPVLNGAAGGWATDQIVLRTEDLMTKLLPRTIIVSFLENDIPRAEYSVYGGGPKPYFVIDKDELILKNVPVPRAIEGATNDIGLTRAILGYSYLVDWTMSRLGREEWFRVNPYVKVLTDPNEVSCLLIKRLKQETDAQGARLIFLMQWGGNAIAEWSARPFHATRVIGCARDAGIQVVDPWQELKAVFAQGQEKLKTLYIMHQSDTLYGHMSSAGNQLIAELLAAAVNNKDLTSTDDAPPGPQSPRVNVPLFDREPQVRYLTTAKTIGLDEPSSSAILLNDQSFQYGVIYQDLLVADDDSVHTISIDLKRGTSSRSQIVMQFLGGTERIFHVYLNTDRMSPDGSEGHVTRTHLGAGWYRVTLSGANNRSGNTILRVLLYPRHGRPEDVGSLSVANARFNP